MRLCIIRRVGVEEAAVVTQAGIVPVSSINCYLGKAWATDLFTLIERGLNRQILADAEQTPGALDPASVTYGPLYRHPQKIWGIA